MIECSRGKETYVQQVVRSGRAMVECSAGAEE